MTTGPAWYILRQRVGSWQQLKCRYILAIIYTPNCNNAVGQQLDTAAKSSGANLGQISSIKFNYQCKPRGGGAWAGLKKRFLYTEQVRLVYFCYYRYYIIKILIRAEVFLSKSYPTVLEPKPSLFWLEPANFWVGSGCDSCKSNKIPEHSF